MGIYNRGGIYGPDVASYRAVSPSIASADLKVLIEALAPGAGLVLRAGTYTITDDITAPQEAFVLLDGAVVWDTEVPNAAALTMLNGAQVKGGQLKILCNDAVGSVGVRFGGASNCQHAHIDDLWVRHADAQGVDFRCDTLGVGVYHNSIDLLRVQYTSATGQALRFSTDHVPAYEVNANVIGHARLQNNLGDVCVVDGGDGNQIVYMEAESNAGWAVDLKKAFGFSVLGGWIEGNTGNIRIANDPSVTGDIRILTSCDSPLTSTDAKFSHTFSTNRSVVVNGSSGQRSFGRARFGGDVQIGLNGIAANDQDGANKLFVAGGMTAYRKSAASPYWRLDLSTGTGLLVALDSTTLIDATSTRMLLQGKTGFTKGVYYGATTQTVAVNGTATTIDANATSLHRVTLQANITGWSAPTNPTAGQFLTIELIQDATGGRTYVFPTNFKWAGGAAPSDTTASKRTTVTMLYDGTNWNEVSRAVAVG